MANDNTAVIVFAPDPRDESRHINVLSVYILLTASRFVVGVPTFVILFPATSMPFAQIICEPEIVKSPLTVVAPNVVAPNVVVPKILALPFILIEPVVEKTTVDVVAPFKLILPVTVRAPVILAELLTIRIFVVVATEAVKFCAVTLLATVIF